MNGLATRPQPKAISSPNAGALDSLPAWLRYLIAAYPGAQVNALTYAVYEDQFADVDGETMMQAVKAAVGAHQYNSFPAVPEIRREIARIGERAALTLHERAAAWRWLRQRRHDLIERSFDGQAEPAEFDALAAEFETLGYEAAAVSLRSRGGRYAATLVVV